jgi:hypothetical protein
MPVVERILSRAGVRHQDQPVAIHTLMISHR